MVGQRKGLFSSSITTRAVGSDLVLLSGNDGTVFLFDHCAKEIRPIIELGRKAAFIYAQKSSKEELFVFATCLGCPTGYLYLFSDMASLSFEKRPKSRYLQLAFPASFVATYSYYSLKAGLWILGSRSGALAFYDTSLPTSDTHSQPCKIVEHVHGEDAITVIMSLPRIKTHRAIYILTAGRDGHYAIHNISLDRSVPGKLEVSFQTDYRATPPFGPRIEGARLDRQSQELILWGFKSKSFIVWNASKDKVTMDFECGGAHRHWTYVPHDDGSDGGTVFWTKASVCYVRSQTQASHCILQAGGHGREIKAMAISPGLDTLEEGSVDYFATGAEDTIIRFWEHNRVRGRAESRIRCLGSFTKHTTGIQQLCWSHDGRFLFSAAGCEELFAWRVQPVPVFGIGAVCKAVCPKVTEDGDLRIMDFCIKEIEHSNGKMVYIISVVYSDSSLRIFQFTDLPSNPDGTNVSLGFQFTLLQTTTYSTNCVTQILNLHLGTPETTTLDYLCTASSDGHIAIWPLSSSLLLSHQPEPQNSVPESNTIEFSHRHRIHQSSIKCMTAIQIPSNASEYLLFTGGDDGALGITRLTFPPLTDNVNPVTDEIEQPVSAQAIPTCSTLLIPKAHAAAINAVAFLHTTNQSQSPTYTQHSATESRSDTQYIFATSGNDQKVKLWGVSCKVDIPGTEGLTVEMKGEKCTSVADVSALCPMLGGDEVLVAGIGMESLKFEEEEGKG